MNNEDLELVPKKTIHKMSEMYDHIERLETALQEIAATPIGLEVPDRTTIWGLAMHMNCVAKDALKEKKNV